MPRSIILIHGALGSAAQVAPLAAALRPHFDVHVLELEGHGQTPASSDVLSIDRFADALAACVAEHSLEAPAVFGYSMGGYVALHLASRSRAIGNIVTLGTKLDWSPDVARRETSRLDAATIRAKVPKFAALLEERHGVAWERVLARTATLMTELGARPPVDAERLARIEQRVRFMVGDRDTVVTVDETAKAARSMPRGELAVLPSTPHPFEQTRTSLVASLVEDFVDGTA